MMTKQNIAIGIYEKALNPKLDIVKKIRFAAELGYDGIQLAVDGLNLMPLTWDQSLISQVTRVADKENIHIISVSLSAHRYYGLADPDVRIQSFAVDLLIKAIHLAKNLGAEDIMLAGYDVCNTAPPENSWNIYRDNLKKVVHFAEKNKIKLAIENVDGPFINNCEKAMQMITEIDSDCLQIFFDMANCLASGFDPLEQLAIGASKINKIHAKDTVNASYRSNIPLGIGDVNFPGIFSKLAAIKFRGAIIIENWYEGDMCIERNRNNLQFLRKLVAEYL
jgi:hexulose-6-phosphate isomerase